MVEARHLQSECAGTLGMSRLGKPIETHDVKRLVLHSSYMPQKGQGKCLVWLRLPYEAALI
jgi:hypothetical protein